MKKNLIKHILSLLLFGSNGIVAGMIALSSIEIVLFRTFLGSLLLVLIFILTKHKVTFPSHKKALIFLGFSGMAMGTSWMFLYEAFSRIGVGPALLTYYFGPVIVMMLSPIIFKEKLTLNKIIGFFIVLVGIFLVNGVATDTSLNRWGLFCGLMSAVTYAVMVIFNKKSASITGLENSTLQLIFAFMTVAIFVGVTTGYNIPIRTVDIPWIIWLGVINTGLGCYLYFSTIGQLPVQTVAICGYIEPLSAVLLAFLILKETMTTTQIIGAVLILGGAMFCEYRKFITSKNTN